MLAVVLALVAAVSFSGSDYAAGRAAREAGEADEASEPDNAGLAAVVRVTVAAELVTTLVVLAVVPFASRQDPSVTALAWGAMAGVSGTAGVMALYAGFQRAAFNVASSVSAVAAAAFSVLTALLLGERPDVLALAGIALTLPAIVAVSATADPAGTRAAGHHAAGVLFGLAAGAGFGLSLISLHRAGTRADLWPVAAAAVASLLTAAVIAAVTGKFGVPPAGTRRLCVLAGVAGASGILCYFLATHQGLLAVTAVIYSLYPAGTIVLARVLSRERLTTVRIGGLCLAAVCVGLIAAGGVR